jgi:histidinol dehydrogenase
MRIWTWPRDRKAVEACFARAGETAASVERAVDAIIDAVRRRGDQAVAEYTKKIDGVALRPDEFDVPLQRLKAAWLATPAPLRRALRTAQRRITAFHKTQRLTGWTIEERGFGRIEERVLPLDRVAVYVPGGKAAYPSTVLMDVIPARVAGVREILLITPPGKDGWPSPMTLAAAHLAGVDRVLRIGGTPGLAAVAFGTKSIPRVDKVVGPGNIYIATAKKRLFGRFDIESVAGPSEVLILADRAARLDWVAADMLAQAEHDQAAVAGAVLIGGDAARARSLQAELERQLATLPRREIAAAALAANGFIITVRTAAEAVELANLKAPEHLEIHARGARRLADRVRHAGAIFVGPWTPEALGDYVAGPNHTLPTGGTARFFSPLGVWEFYKTSHTVEATRAGLAALARDITTLAEAEGLSAHAEAVRRRRRMRSEKSKM